MINAASTPSILPANVRIKTITTDPQPLSITDNGGKMMAKITRKMDMIAV